MKQKINKFIDWFEDKFDFIIDITALIGGAFCIRLAIFVFVMVLIFDFTALDYFGIIFIPGAIGFLESSFSLR
ncbi:MAG: hypothetical protein KKG64_00795 [Firmicutes bacterium]|nr:hypothetical protein [Bacillota bacterium]